MESSEYSGRMKPSWALSLSTTLITFLAPSYALASNDYRLPNCPKIEFGPNYLLVTYPAKFPNPERVVKRSGFGCGGYQFSMQGEEVFKEVIVSGPSWEAAWNAMTKGDYPYFTKVDIMSDLSVERGIASIRLDLGYVGAKSYNDPKIIINKNVVVAISSNVGPMKPILFDQKITPQKLEKGVNLITMKSMYPYSVFRSVSINTLTNTIHFNPTRGFHP
jgi:hypothetical protein